MKGLTNCDVFVDGDGSWHREKRRRFVNILDIDGDQGVGVVGREHGENTHCQVPHTLQLVIQQAVVSRHLQLARGCIDVVHHERDPTRRGHDSPFGTCIRGSGSEKLQTHSGGQRCPCGRVLRNREGTSRELFLVHV